MASILIACEHFEVQIYYELQQKQKQKPYKLRIFSPVELLIIYVENIVIIVIYYLLLRSIPAPFVTIYCDFF